MTKPRTFRVHDTSLCVHSYGRQVESRMMSGGPINPFTKGWAIIPFSGEKPHFWIEDKETMPPKIGKHGRVRYYTSLCGVVGVTNSAVNALAPGDFPKCKRCSKSEVPKCHKPTPSAA